jgi:hypothetical protein
MCTEDHRSRIFTCKDEPWSCQDMSIRRSSQVSAQAKNVRVHEIYDLESWHVCLATAQPHRGHNWSNGPRSYPIWIFGSYPTPVPTFLGVTWWWSNSACSSGTVHWELQDGTYQARHGFPLQGYGLKPWCHVFFAPKNNVTRSHRIP